jgi:hypothetical protein
MKLRKPMPGFGFGASAMQRVSKAANPFNRQGIAKAFGEVKKVRAGLREINAIREQRYLSPQERQMREYLKRVQEIERLNMFEANMKLSSEERFSRREIFYKREAEEKMRLILSELNLKGNTRMGAILEKELIEKLGMDTILQADPQALIEAFHASPNLKYIVSELNQGRKVHPLVMEKAVLEISAKLEEGE